jgi:hypothetical protein
LATVEVAKTKHLPASTLTEPTIALTELVEKGADADPLKQMIQFVAQRVMGFTPLPNQLLRSASKVARLVATHPLDHLQAIKGFAFLVDYLTTFLYPDLRGVYRRSVLFLTLPYRCHQPVVKLNFGVVILPPPP